LTFLDKGLINRAQSVSHSPATSIGRNIMAYEVFLAPALW
jgi:hypothetical protein